MVSDEKREMVSDELQRPCKKPKLGPDLNSIAESAWDSYRDYLDSTHDEETPEGEIDALEEMVQDLVALLVEEYGLNEEGNEKDIREEDKEDEDWTSAMSRLKILISVCYCDLAEHSMSQWLAKEDEAEEAATTSGDDLEDNHRSRAQQLILKSLRYFASNAAAWSMGANLGRISQKFSLSETCEWYEQAIHCASEVRSKALRILDSENVDTEIKGWVEMLLLDRITGVEYLSELQILCGDDLGDCDGDEDTDDGNDDDDDGDDNENEKKDGFCNRKKKNDTKTRKNNNKEKQEKKKNAEETETRLKVKNKGDGEGEEEEIDIDDEGIFSSSAVEALSRFMVAMIYSTLGRHDSALLHLKKFPLTHRLHENVWKELGTTTTEKSAAGNSDSKSGIPIEPVSFSRPEGILPDKLYKRLCELFAPGAPYWKESKYSQRGYYSYFMDDENESCKNLVQDVIDHLRPMAQKFLDMNYNTNSDDDNGKEKPPQICGAEWWVHTRPIKANLGHNLHFDTDEALLRQDGTISHPIVSSVLYLTGGEENNEQVTPGGATIVLDQSPDSENVADMVWKSVPRNNSYMLFPGNLLHGVLPCPGEVVEGKENETVKDNNNSDDPGKKKNLLELLKIMEKGDEKNKNNSKQQKPKHRLTFMVGWWTRRVPDKMKDRKLYGPCGPLPPATDEHSWVKEILKGYPAKRQLQEQQKLFDTKDVSIAPLPTVKPAWEIIESDDSKKGENHEGDNEEEGDADGDDAVLEIPAGIDHRFFVDGAPDCFRESLFEHDESDEDVELEEEEEDVK